MILAAAVITAAGVAGCHDGGSNGLTVPPPNANNAENFSTLATQLYGQSATSTPFNFDTVAITYDVNEDPTAFNALLM